MRSIDDKENTKLFNTFHSLKYEDFSVINIPQHAYLSFLQVKRHHGLLKAYKTKQQRKTKQKQT